MRLPLSLIFACLTLLSLPAYVVRFQFGPLPTTLLEILILLTVLTWSVESWHHSGLAPFFEWVKSKVFVLGVMLMLWTLVEVFAAPNLRSAAGTWRAYFLEPVLLGWIVTDLTRRGYGRWLLAALVGSGIWVTAIAVAQISFHQLTTINDRSALQISWGRAVSVYYTGNAVALFLGPIIALLVAALFRYSAVLPVLGFIVLGLLDSKSRGGLGAGILGSLSVLAVWFRDIFSERMQMRLWRMTAFIPVLAALAFGIIFFNVSNLVSYTPLTGTTRLCIWDGTKEIIAKSPILGAGLDGFGPAYAKTHTCNSEDLIYPHNFFLNFWTETGLPGLLVVIALFSLLLYELRLSSDKLLAAGLVGAFIYLLIHGQVDVPYFKNDLAAEFWVLAGFTVATTKFKANFLSKN